MSQIDQPDRPRPTSTGVSDAVAKQIDENLKRLYQQSLDEDLPETLKALVARLRDEGTTSR
ncbi:MAG: hypothetical protein HLUCCA12_12985 [Rhodobacteraceae bacterium HLUCCA12]|nr:MAG: hypothetical protein HLUCCA12_12985 [Rhodobacteraceae bacterium HLUCCA12]